MKVNTEKAKDAARSTRPSIAKQRSIRNALLWIALAEPDR
jgi:hypothetical protein